MEVESNSNISDLDLDNELLQKLNSMGTRDKEDLINQFQSIVGTQLTHSACSFYLDMGNWNLQTALGAYYDVMTSSEKLPLFCVVDETTHVAENSIPPCQSFVKSWRFKNIGNDRWPNNLKLKYVGGTNYSHGDCVSLPPLEPNETADISITMIGPFTEGTYEGRWRFVTLSGIYCGSMLKVLVNINASNVNVLAKEMSLLGNNLHPNGTSQSTQPMSTPLRPQTHPTPFCSPTGYGMFGGTNTTNGVNGNLPVINENMQNMNMNMNRYDDEMIDRTTQQFMDQNISGNTNGEFNS